MSDDRDEILPRGILNNNPGNIKFNPAFVWVGQRGKDAGGFVVFDTPQHGLRAMAMDACHIIRSREVDTIYQLVMIWDGAVDVNHEEYADYVASQVGVGLRETVKWDEVGLATMRAMIMFENGQCPYPVTVLSAAIKAAHIL